MRTTYTCHSCTSDRVSLSPLTLALFPGIWRKGVGTAGLVSDDLLGPVGHPHDVMHAVAVRHPLTFLADYKGGSTSTRGIN